MLIRAIATISVCLLLPHGCDGPWGEQMTPLKHRATGGTPETIALYEAWFGHPRHTPAGYSSHDPAVISKQIQHAKAMGISAFVVDWYGSREPFIDQSYALVQAAAAEGAFQVAMMYDETDEEDGATEATIADLKAFHDVYLTPNSHGQQAYLHYEGRPMIFIFPKGTHTDWNRVRTFVDKWNPSPLLIYENSPGPYAAAFDGFYAWINPGEKGWSGDGSNWGEDYLSQYYRTMRLKHADKIIVGGIWAGFNDRKASWGLNRYISARCGQTFKDTSELWHRHFSPNDPPPFVMIETWNDHEEGSAVEGGIPACDAGGHELLQEPSF